MNFSFSWAQPKRPFWENCSVSHPDLVHRSHARSDQCYDIDDHSGDVQPWKLVIQFWCMLMVVDGYLTLPRNRWDMDTEGCNKCWVGIRNCIKAPTGYRVECYQVCIYVIKKIGAFKMDIIQCHTYSISKVFNSNQNLKLYLMVFSFEYLRGIK